MITYLIKIKMENKNINIAAVTDDGVTISQHFGRAKFYEVVSMNNLNSTISKLKYQVDGNLKNILRNVNEITANNKSNIDSLMISLNNNSIELSNFIGKSSNAVEQLKSFFTSINKGKGSLGAIVKNDSLYQNINHSITSIDSLVSDIRQNSRNILM